MLLQGDCLTQLQNLEANSVDSIVTDPPYGLGFMGKEWDSLPPGQEVFEQCLRVLKPGGHLLCFAGSGTTGLACMKEGCHYILIDADSQSLDIARRRLLSEIVSQEWPLRNYKLI